MQNCRLQMYVNFAPYSHVENLSARISIFRFTPRNVRAREFKKPLRILRARYFIPVAQGGHTTPSFAYLSVIVKNIMRAIDRNVYALNRQRSGKINLSRHARDVEVWPPHTQHASLLENWCCFRLYSAKNGRRESDGRYRVYRFTHPQVSERLSAWRVSLR